MEEIAIITLGAGKSTIAQAMEVLHNNNTTVIVLEQGSTAIENKQTKMGYRYDLLAMEMEILTAAERNLKDTLYEQGISYDGCRIKEAMKLHLINMGVYNATTEQFTKRWYQWIFKHLLYAHKNLKSIHKLFHFNKTNRLGIHYYRLNHLNIC